MAKLKTLSKGKRLVSPRAYFISNYLNTLLLQDVAVPVSLSSNIFMFDFQTELEKSDELKSISREQISRIIAVMGRATSAVDKEWLKQALIEGGFAESQGSELNKVIDKLREAIIVSVGRSGISGLLIKDVLSGAVEEGELETLQLPSYPAIASGLGLIQDMYAQFALSNSVEVIGSFITESLFQNELIGMARKLHSIFHESASSSVPLKLSYVVDSIMTKIHGSPMVSKRSVLDAYHYEITDVAFLDGFTYSDAVATSILGLRTLMGVSVNIDPDETGKDGKVGVKFGERSKTAMVQSMSSIVAQMVTGVGSNAPTIPETLNFDFDRCQKAFQLVYTSRLIERIVTGDFGTLSGRIRNVMDSRKYERNESYDSIIKKALDVSSAVFEAFLDTSAFFRSLAKNDEIYFEDVIPKYRKKYNEFIWDFFGQFKTFSLPITHARFLYEPALIVNHSYEVIATLPSSLLDSQTLKNGKKVIQSIQDFSTYEFFKTQVLHGSVVDSQIEGDLRVLQVANLVSPTHYLSMPLPDVMKSDVFKFTFSFMRLEDLLKKSPIVEHFLDQTNLVLISSPEDMARLFNLPFKAARQMFKKPEVYVDLSAIRTSIYTWENELGPIFEAVFPADDESVHVMPFVAYSPFLQVREFSAPSPEIKVPVLDISKKPKVVIQPIVDPANPPADPTNDPAITDPVPGDPTLE
jgi:hypothetical protein